VRGDDRNCRIPDRGPEHQRRPVRRPPAVTNRKKRPHEGSHHGVAERIRLYRRDSEATLSAPPLQSNQPADRGRTLPATAVRREVVLAEQATGGAVHGVQVERPFVPQDVVAAQRIQPGRVVSHPVGIAAGQRREARVEAGRRGCNCEHPDVFRKDTGQPAHDRVRRAHTGREPLACVPPRSSRDIGVRHLTTGMDAGVGPARHGQAGGPAKTQDDADRVLDDGFDRAPTRLAGPAREAPAVIAEIKPQPKEPAVPGFTMSCLIGALPWDGPGSGIDGLLCRAG
jgi:hypothetical protein